MGFPSFAVVSTTLIDALGWKEIGDHFAIGSLSANDGTKSAKYVTLMARGSYAYTRGDAQSPRRLCPECGRLILLATGEPYLCAVEPSKYLQTSDGDLTVRADVFERKLRGIPLPMVRVLPLDVKDSPLDGLPRTTAEIVAMLRDIQSKPVKHVK